MADSIETVGLTQGLNSVTPPILAENGTLLDCLNYEVVPQIGYKKIDGYETYDGFISGGVDQIYRANTSASVSTGDFLLSEEEEPVATVVGIPLTGVVDFVLNSPAASMPADVEDIVPLSQSGISVEELYELMRLYMSFLRNRTQDLPDTVVGLHWFEDRLYAVAGEGDEAQLYYSVDEFISQEEGISRGWHELDPGLFVEFEKGYSPSDALTTYSRAFATQEPDPRPSPTPITGASGSAIALRQGVNISNDLTKQARGWKPSSAPTTYDVRPQAIQDSDSSYIYADANYRWISNISTVNVGGGYRTGQLNEQDPAYMLGGLNIGGSNASREFGASNAYTTLILEGVENLGENLPLNSVIEGIEVEVTYSAEVLMYGRNVMHSDPLDPEAPPSPDPTPVENAAFDILQALNLRAIVLKGDQNTYTRLGNGSTVGLTTEKSSFSQTETGTKDNFRDQWRVFSAPKETVTIGGPTDLLGNNLLSYADLVSSFGLGLTVEPEIGTKPSYADSGAAAYRVKIDRVRIKVYFQKKSSYYYIVGTDGNVLRGTLTSYAIEYGNLSTGDAAGSAHFYGLEQVEGSRDTPQAGDKLYVNYPVGSEERPVMEITSSTVATLPGPALVEKQNSRYLFRSANFYGDAEWDAMYGVSGAGRAFFWDGHVLGFVMTQYDPNKDMPRHVAIHHNHLVLGYRSGSVQLSVIGEPTNFRGVDGASEFPMGDTVTGLLSLNGTTLGVFCARSIHSIAGSSVQNFTQQTISPKQGAIEYSVVDMGQPMFATTNGISTLEQTAAYGDFIGSRVADQVATWLPKRLLGSDKRTNSYGVACAIPVRAKNQYRLFFKDGLVLSLTMNGQINPVMTSRYTYQGSPIVPLAASSEVDHIGRERLFVSHGAKVFELDTGWGFAGEWFPHFLELAPIFPTNGSNYGGIDRVRMHGQTKGMATLDVRIEGVEESYLHPYTLNTQDLSMPINSQPYSPEFYPSLTVVDHASRGLGLKMLISGTQPENLTDTEPSHICQVLLLHMITDGARDN